MFYDVAQCSLLNFFFTPFCITITFLHKAPCFDHLLLFKSAQEQGNSLTLLRALRRAVKDSDAVIPQQNAYLLHELSVVLKHSTESSTQKKVLRKCDGNLQVTQRDHLSECAAVKQLYIPPKALIDWSVLCVTANLEMNILSLCLTPTFTSNWLK